MMKNVFGPEREMYGWTAMKRAQGGLVLSSNKEQMLASILARPLGGGRGGGAARAR